MMDDNLVIDLLYLKYTYCLSAYQMLEDFSHQWFQAKYTVHASLSLLTDVIQMMFSSSILDY